MARSAGFIASIPTSLYVREGGNYRRIITPQVLRTNHVVWEDFEYFDLWGSNTPFKLNGVSTSDYWAIKRELLIICSD